MCTMPAFDRPAADLCGTRAYLTEISGTAKSQVLIRRSP